MRFACLCWNSICALCVLASGSKQSRERNAVGENHDVDDDNDVNDDEDDDTDEEEEAEDEYIGCGRTFDPFFALLPTLDSILLE